MNKAKETFEKMGDNQITGAGVGAGLGVASTIKYYGTPSQKVVGRGIAGGVEAAFSIFGEKPSIKGIRAAKTLQRYLDPMNTKLLRTGVRGGVGAVAGIIAAGLLSKKKKK